MSHSLSHSGGRRNVAKSNEGGEIRTLDLGIKSPLATRRGATAYPAVPRSAAVHSYATKPEARAKVAQGPTVCPTA